MSQSPRQPITYLADSNILLRLAQASHPLHTTAQAAVKNIQAAGDEIMIAVQSLFEYWAVATRPTTARDGLGLSTADAKKGMDFFRRLFPLCSEEPLFTEWERLVVTYATQGAPAHDARYIAVMKTHGITHLLTFDTKDLNRYVPEGITVVDPASVPAPVPQPSGAGG